MSTKAINSTNFHETIDWNKLNGLLPAIIQSASDYSVLMLGYMNLDALNQTLETGLVTFFSRTKQRLWVKGETSGNFLKVKECFLDCDSDSLLIHVDDGKETCHRGSRSCFSTDNTSLSFLSLLESVIHDRIQNKHEESYTYKLFNRGKQRIAQKIGEEATEVVIASISEDKENLLQESADLVYHLLLNLHYHGFKHQDVLEVLKQRRGLLHA